MKNIANLQTNRSLESFALDQTERFLRPRTFLDMIFLLLLVFWWISATLFSAVIVLRASFFIFAVILFFFIPLYGIFNEEKKTNASVLNRAIKVLIFYVLIIIFVPTVTGVELWDVTVIPFTYNEIENLLVCLLIPIAIMIKALSLEVLKLGYSYYIGRILNGYWYSTLILFILLGIKVYHPIEAFSFDIELLLIFAFFAYLIGTSTPSIPPQLSLTTGAIFNQFFAFKTRTERLRDSLLLTGFVLLVFLWLPQWIVKYRDLFNYFALISIALGIILIAAPQPKSKNGYGSLISSLTGLTLDPASTLGNRVQNFAKSVRETEFQQPREIYTIPTDELKIISKGKSTLKAKKGTLAIPTVTDKGTALVLMGKSEIKTTDQDQDVKEIDGTTTLWLPPDEWENVKVQLNSKHTADLTSTELISAGVENISEIYDKALIAFNNLKSWKGPKGIFSSVLDPGSSKYSITETKDYSRIRLPGVYIYESKEIEIVNILGGVVKIIEIKGVGEYVQIFGGFVTVLETPQYSFVQTPFVSVIETPKGEIVKVFGINIQEGEKFDLEEAREQIINDQKRFDSFFSNQLDSIFKEDPQLLFVDSKGEKGGLVIGEESMIGDLEISSKKIQKPTKPQIKEISNQKTSSKKSLKNFMFQKHITVTTKTVPSSTNKESTSSKIINLNLNDNDFEQKMIDLEMIERKISEIEENIDTIDKKFLKDEISENKHSEIINRLMENKKNLIQKRDEIQNKL